MREKIERFLRNKDGKVLLGNFLSLSVLNIASYVFPLITLPYLSRVIGVDKFGEIALGAAIIGYFVTVVDWGFTFTATRDIAKNQKSIKRVSVIYSNVMWSMIFLMLLSFLILLLLILLLPKFSDICSVLLLTFLIIPGNIMFPQWLFQGLERMRYITLFNILSKFFFTVAVFIFIKTKEDFIYQPLFVSLGYIVAGFCSLYIIFCKWKIKLYRPRIKSISNTLNSSKDVFINQLSPNLYNSFSMLLLGLVSGNTAVGKLDAGSKFISIGQRLMEVLSRTFFPFLSRKITAHSLYARVAISISLLFSIALFVLAPSLVYYIFTPEFVDSIHVLQILSFSVFFIALTNVYGTNYLIIMGYERLLRNITVVSSITGLLLSIVLVNKYSFIGAALTISLTRAMMGLLTFIYAKKIICLK